MPRKNYSTAKKSGKKKPHLEWRVITVNAQPSLGAYLGEQLCKELQALTDEKFRIFSINTVRPDELIVSAYLSAWTAAESDTEEPPA